MPSTKLPRYSPAGAHGRARSRASEPGAVCGGGDASAPSPPYVVTTGPRDVSTTCIRVTSFGFDTTAVSAIAQSHV